MLEKAKREEEMFNLDEDEEEKEWMKLDLMMKKIKEEPEFEEMTWDKKYNREEKKEIEPWYKPK